MKATFTSAKAAEALRITFYLGSLGWLEGEGYGGQLVYHEGGDSQKRSVFLRDVRGHCIGWELCHFTDSDIDGEAVGRYVTDSEGETLEELKEELKCSISF